MKLSPFLLLLWVGSAAAQPPAAWTPEFAMQFQAVSTVVPSPDGKLVAWVQTRNVIESERSEQLPHVFLGRADGTRRIQLTRGEKGASNPAFSPDGQFVYFTSDRFGKTNIFRIPVDGGEAEAVSEFKGELGSYKVSPDGKWVAFAGAEPLADEEQSKKEKRDFRIIDEYPADHALYLVPAEPGLDGKRAQKKLAGGKLHIINFDWSPDSRHIAFDHQPTPLADDWTLSDISEVDVATGQVKPLAATPAAERNPYYSANGHYLAFERSATRPGWLNETRIAILNLQRTEVRDLAATYDEAPTLLGWTGDSSSILYIEARHTRNALHALPLDGPEQVVYGPGKGVLSPGGTRLNASGTYAGFAMESPEEAPEAFVMALGAGSPTRVSRANLDVPKLPLAKTDVVRWKSRDGLEIEGLLTYPLEYQKGKKYPLILNIHGGPAGVFTETFIGKSGLYPIATFAGRGYAVLRPNPRGSTGYGKKFRFANAGDWGGKDYEVDQAGVDKLIEMGLADPDRLAVMGWSYGGFMTSWTITQTHRFKAAAVGAGVTNLWSFTGTADVPGFIPDYFGGEPWEQFEAFRKHSPVAHVNNVNTPTLILHGEADQRVPISQGYEYYNALKRRGITTKMVVYPRTPDGPREPKFVLDIMHRHLDWLDTYVR